MIPRLVCFGNLTIDDIVLPNGTERPGCTGGDALYAALAARAFEPATGIVAPIGRDFPDSLLERIAERGLDVQGLPQRHLPTLRNRVVYRTRDARDWTLHASEAEFEALSPTPDDIPPAYRSAGAFLVLAMALAAQERLVGWLSSMPALTILDPQEDYIAGNHARLRAMIAAVDIFMPSAAEVEHLLGTRAWESAARQLAGWGPRIVVLKLGADGVLIHDARRDRTVAVPAMPGTQVVDTTGAGDSFCGAFAAQLLQTPDDLDAAARAGAAAAAVAISDYGVEPLLRATPADIRQGATAPDRTA